ncbi:hypothetical protein [Pontivivens insulae]|uniref:Uncharacterized protein n=1 Tax=Pontivivens insulae TaxID=1639689 RepID=A0A2R8AGE7_9RHOB|nr:hypothetical protein [Pontivivens insulae]RED10632.1 hypothetical protein DFR53_3447 [Pontivivens insulae]SPF31158.1 hypothetical protein POI8812_03509 [Pontivivens insulae]
MRILFAILVFVLGLSGGLHAGQPELGVTALDPMQHHEVAETAHDSDCCVEEPNGLLHCFSLVAVVQQQEFGEVTSELAAIDRSFDEYRLTSADSDTLLDPPRSV